ncbi:PH domain-containing protein [Aurantimonas sp. C2-6-R+9]|uniref:PH domain-containing protein n=1 Tax=unclassified Aurantimonas TaxID=2638230 RepID=UPI002E19E649|nr:MULTISPECIES: PH domain-containing protein [unclassified Aurantimonas]MEC5289748.1 PH domain-containing protein [Aurantimonas sp. C2-3-R2]MEC5322316.1 PH domain-containing protein [Aurantimonas sp. A3-2-R12]MEC5379715.1 PH domain-containing protein [Aurantimonas sp. C2-6-R+9]MEC5410814.1 PH domain-containing protein [Aurantimonas sp. C2-4-R8]
MGLLSGIMGLTSDADIDEVRSDLDPMLLADEDVDLAFRVVRDLFVFTDLRLIIVDKQGMTGRKRHIQTIPYRSITMFAIETAGNFDADSELTLWMSGQPPLLRQLSRRADIAGIQRALAHGVLDRK